MLPLSQWILKTACIEFAALQKELPSLLYLSINISPAELMSKNFVEQVINACDLASLSYDLIQLEITEHALLADYDGAVKQLSLLHGLGKLITAEGIETFEQAEFLRQEKINTGQGWYYGKPMDIKTLLIKTSELTFL